MQTKKIKGIILKNSWTPHQEQRISIYTLQDEHELLVKKNEIEQQLGQHLGKVLLAEGIIETDYSQLPYHQRSEILITRYVLL